MERLSAVTHLTSSAEYLARPAHYARGSLGDWQINRERFAFLGPRRRAFLDRVASPRVTICLHAARVASSVALLLPSARPVRAVASAVLASTSAALYPRHHLGTDGSDQVGLQTSLAAFVARSSGHPGVQDSALWYVALQASLGYFVSGTVKMFGPSWRSGQAVPGVMRTVTYGCRPLWAAVRSRPRLASLGAHTMLLGEAGFPLVYATGGRLAWPFVAGAAAFHTGIGLSMGLGRFVTAFGSMLPAVAYTSSRSPRSALLPRIAMAAAGGAFAVGLADSVIRRSRVRRPTASHHEVTVDGEGTVRYTMHGRRIDEAPVIVLEHGMLSTPEHFAWLVEELSPHACVVTFSRLGYGASVARPGAGSGRRRSRPDIEPIELIALIDHLSPRCGRLFVGGHSLGGYLARRAALARPDVVAGVVYLDSSHPAQLVRSKRQRDGAAHLDMAFQGITASLRLGLGWLLTEPAWVRSLPDHVRRRAVKQYRDSRLWSAGLREWSAAKRHFDGPAAQRLPPSPCPALVIAAERSLRNDPAQSDLNLDLAAAHPSAVQVVVRGATHDSLLTSEQHARAAGRAVRRFVAPEVSDR